ncbi:MAG: hypothetical protein QME94_09775 [Anaerolineae bacterium]|nr:hypothetical protein [Anaerolineae bacterium]
MIVGYDAPNHALLLHFGSPRRRLPLSVDAWEARYTPGCLSRVESAFDPDTGSLVAILFCWRGFFMPSYGSRQDLLARWRLARSASEVRVELGAVPRPHDPVWVRPGLQLFLSLPQRTGRERPFLHGLRIHTVAQPVELDLAEMDVRVAPNSLESATADLFAQVGP